MQKITFTKKAILISFWDESQEKWQDRDISESQLPISWYLPYEVFIEPKVTIRDILTLLEPYFDHLSFIFVNYLKGLSLDDVKKCLTDSKSEKPIVKIAAMCLIWVGEIKEIEGDEESIDIYPTLMALEIDADDPGGENDTFHSALDVNLKQLMDSEFVLDDLLEIYREDDPEQTEVTGVTGWSLFDFIRGLLSELVIYSFANRLIQLSELSNMPPLTADELFKHMDNLDKFYKNERKIR